ncbi:MAG TPA: hypothetical protein VGF18_04805 [Candidatus Tumulicola sp.]|jgi:hypothetical protein
MDAPITENRLLSMSQAQLDALFTSSSPGPIPNGEAHGTAIIAPGTTYDSNIAQCINTFAWQGKIFNAERGTLVNRISRFGIEAILADVYVGTSWFDQKPCIVLDYSKTSTFAHWIRDEIRQIAPNTYLGIVYWAKQRLIHFSLEFGQ